jgi:hypothetical protein
MHIRIAQVRFDPSRVDEALAVIREHGLPSMRLKDGVGNVYVAVDREVGRVTIVSTWDTLEHPRFANPPDFVARFEGLGPQSEQGGARIFEVTDQV